MTGQLNGTCACGCGMRTNISKYGNDEQGIKAGQHFRFVHGHHHKIMRQINPNYGKQYDRNKLREKRRGEIIESILNSKGQKSLNQIRIEVAPEFRLEGISMMLRSAREWRVYGEIPNILLRTPKKVIPLYERKEIPYERETEISLLVNQRRMILLDKPIIDGTGSNHEMWGNDSLTPLEILLLKEEMESEEYQERERRLEEWRRFEIRRNSVHKELILQ